MPARAETSIRLEDIAEQLSRIARREQNTAPASYGSENRYEDEENFTKILNRIESNERQTVEAFTAVNERLAVLSRQVLQTAKMPTISKPEDRPPSNPWKPPCATSSSISRSANAAPATA